MMLQDRQEARQARRQQEALRRRDQEEAELLEQWRAAPEVPQGPQQETINSTATHLWLYHALFEEAGIRPPLPSCVGFKTTYRL